MADAHDIKKNLEAIYPGLVFWSNIPGVPLQFSHMPIVWREGSEQGYPVPYVNKWQDDRPLFDQYDRAKIIACARHKLCAICGEVLPKGVYYHIATENSLKEKVSTEPPMHSFCAHYALAACPHLFFEKGNVNTAHNDREKHKKLLFKPKILYIVLSTHFKINFKAHQLLFGFKPKRVTEFCYQNGMLTPKEPLK